MTRYNQRKNSKSKLPTILVIAVVISIAYLFLGGHFSIKVLDASEEEQTEVENYFVVDSTSEISLEDLLNPGAKNVIFFTSSWCSSCKYTSSVLKETSRNFPEIKFYEIDLDSKRALASEFGAEFVSQFVFIENDEYKLVKDLDSSDIQTSVNLFNNTGIFSL